MNTCIIGISGGTASGKSSLATRILDYIKNKDTVLFISHDSYYKSVDNLSEKELKEYNFDHPNSLETQLLIEHLKKLKNGESCNQPVYNFEIRKREVITKKIEPKPIIILDGILILAEPSLRELLDIKIFVDTDADIRILRRIKRDSLERGRSLDSIIEQYLSTVKTMHDQFVEPSKRYADIIVPAQNYNEVAEQFIFTYINNKLNSYNYPIISTTKRT